MSLFSSIFSSGNKKKKHSDAYFAFDDKYYNKCMKMYDRADDVDTDFDDPAQCVKGMKKKLALLSDLKKFCYNSGNGGIEFYEEHFSKSLLETQNEYNSLIENYDSLVSQYHENFGK